MKTLLSLIAAVLLASCSTQIISPKKIYYLQNGSKVWATHAGMFIMGPQKRLITVWFDSKEVLVSDSLSSTLTTNE
jgi:uncharacterized lipoprotein YmbA